MSIIFSKACEYGIQAVLFIATQNGRRVGIKEIASTLEIPVHFLAKILQSLSEKGILLSFKGSTGGFELNGDPTSIRLLNVVGAIDGLALFTNCVLGFPECGSEHPCPVHERWGGVRTVIYGMLSTDTLADLLPVSSAKIQRITDRAREALSAGGI
jgi:Rrf2 family transcriptional regulator, iron-sulfur cluster assembly transcription factor